MRRIWWGLQAAMFLTCSLPLSFLPVKAGELFGLILCYLWKERREIATDNLKKSVALHALSLPHSPEEVIKEHFRNLGRFFIEIIKIYYGRGKRIFRQTTIRGLENFEKASARGKGVIFLTGHCGNWELLAIAFSFHVTSFSLVARPLNNPYLNALLEKARSRYGNRTIYKRGALRAIISTLRSGGNVGILMDQAVLSDEGFVIDFLGRGAWTSRMPALIARKTTAAVLPAFIRREGKGHEIIIYPEVTLSSLSDHGRAVRQDTQAFSRFIEEYIRTNPSEWLWLHKRWKRVHGDRKTVDEQRERGDGR
jgi:KDO2-lipid IV(A) lauroyltransferase